MKFFTTSTTTTIAAAICCTLFFIGIKKSIDSNTPLNSLSSETKLAIAESPKIGQTPQQTVPILEKSSVAQLSKVSKPFKTGRLWDAQSDIEAAIEDDEATEEANEKRTVEARWAAEFEMIKDPKTGQMPRGIHQKELIAAKKVRALQLPAELSEDGLSVRSLPTIGITPRGPNNYGGRTLALGIDVRNTNIVIAGGASAGIFRSTDGGANWTRVTPSGEIHSVTAIAQDTRAGQQDTWYCGSGERNSGSSNGVGATYFGNGLWKSTNNGVTWTALASTQSDLYSFDNDFDFINRIVVNPTNGDILVGASETVKRSADGGATWATVAGNTATTTGRNTDIIYNAVGAAFYAAIHGGDAQGGIYRSTDGIAWTLIRTPAQLEVGGVKRIVLSNVANTANILAFCETNNTVCMAGSKVVLQLFDATSTSWTDHSQKIGTCAGGSSNPKNIATQGGYNMCITTKPDDANIVYLGGTEIYRLNLATSVYEYIGGDQGTANATNLHVDNHLLVFEPLSNTTLWACNDGGMRKTDVTGTITAGPTGGYAWTDRTTNYTTHQYYGADINPTNGSDFVAGAAQDNAFTIQPTTATAKEVGPTVDGVSIGLISGTDFTTFNSIIAWQNGALARLTGSNGTGVDIQPTGQSQGFLTYFFLDNDNSNILYYPTNMKKLYRTRNAAALSDGTISDASTNWDEITGVAATLTGNVSRMATTRNINLANAAYSASNTARKIYMGTEDGKVYRLADPAFTAAATTPVNITPTGAAGYVSGIAVNPYNDKEVLVCYSNYNTPSVWYTADATVATPTWVNVEGAAGSAVELASARTVAIVRAGSTMLYLVGTSTGLYGTMTLSGATTVWEKIGANEIALSPSVSMRLRTSDNKMSLGTHGNGLFMLTFPSSIVPLDLLAFDAVKNNANVHLKWISINEVSFSHYNVQKSDDGKYFSLLTKVKATSAGTYEVDDEKPFAGQNYYRLEMVDVDGSKRYSKVVNVAFDAKNKAFSVYPNPANTNAITLEATLDNDSYFTFEWFDIAGRSRLVSQQKANQGANQIQVDVSALEKGMYFITTRKAASNEILQTMRFIKQ